MALVFTLCMLQVDVTDVMQKDLYLAFTLFCRLLGICENLIPILKSPFSSWMPNLPGN